MEALRLDETDQKLLEEAGLVTARGKARAVSYVTSEASSPRLSTNVLSIVRKTDLEWLPDSGKLIELALDSCNITSLRGISRCTRLQVLSAEDNALTEIPELYELTKLKELILNGNSITRVQGERLPPSLQIVTLSNNKIESLTALHNLPQLRELDVSNNLLTTTPNFAKNQQLEILDLSGNKLQTVPTASILTLQTLNMSCNEIQSLEGLNALPALTELYLADNELSDLEALARYCTQLEVIDIEANPLTLTAVASTLSKLPKLKEIHVSDAAAEITGTDVEALKPALRIHSNADVDGEDAKQLEAKQRPESAQVKRLVDRTIEQCHAALAKHRETTNALLAKVLSNRRTPIASTSAPTSAKQSTAQLAKSPSLSSASSAHNPISTTNTSKSEAVTKSSSKSSVSSPRSPAQDRSERMPYTHKASLPSSASSSSSLGRPQTSSSLVRRPLSASRTKLKLKEALEFSEAEAGETTSIEGSTKRRPQTERTSEDSSSPNPQSPYTQNADQDSILSTQTSTAPGLSLYAHLYSAKQTAPGAKPKRLSTNNNAVGYTRFRCPS